jgi:hypothetical protein
MEVLKIRREDAKANMKVLTWHVPGDTEENCEKLLSTVQLHYGYK